jgi:hypothetical protein
MALTEKGPRGAPELIDPVTGRDFVTSKSVKY